MRKWASFKLHSSDNFVNQLVTYSRQWLYFLLLNSNKGKTSPNLYSSFDIVAAADAIFTTPIQNTCNFDALKEFHNKHNDWIFGHLSYDLKNELERLNSENPDGIEFPELFFFVPKFIFVIKNGTLQIGYLPEKNTTDSIQSLYRSIIQQNVDEDNEKAEIGNIHHNVTQAEYFKTLEKIQEHILRGDIYELNYCTAFFSENASISPESTYLSLNKISPAPFSGYYKLDDKYLFSSSPERFLAKRGQKVISQPIKGTIKRGKTNEDDERLKQLLATDPKERAENIMIVDLVRNDLTKTAKIGSVKVEELCKIYSFKYVHQMISTIVAETGEDPVEVIKSAFPMGSMTGAPKVRAMKLIEKYEKTRRGLFSGCIGYISPDKDFDFNVIIRSILYNQTNRFLSLSVGSAITYQSISENEYQECLLKAEAMRRVFFDC